MATHFSIISWEIPWTEESGGLQLDLIEWLNNKYIYIYVNPSPSSSHTSSPTMSTYLFSVSASQTPALQIGSPVPFSRFHIYVLIYNIWFCFPVF